MLGKSWGVQIAPPIILNGLGLVFFCMVTKSLSSVVGCRSYIVAAVTGPISYTLKCYSWGTSKHNKLQLHSFNNLPVNPSFFWRLRAACLLCSIASNFIRCFSMWLRWTNSSFLAASFSTSAVTFVWARPGRRMPRCHGLYSYPYMLKITRQHQLLTSTGRLCCLQLYFLQRRQLFFDFNCVLDLSADRCSLVICTRNAI